MVPLDPGIHCAQIVLFLVFQLIIRFGKHLVYVIVGKQEKSFSENYDRILSFHFMGFPLTFKQSLCFINRPSI